MQNVRTFQQAFSGGEVSPEFFGRFGDSKYQSGAAKLENFISLPHGPAVNRPGFAFVREVKNSNTKVRLLPFIFSNEQTLVIEVGAGYFRFHTQGATLLSGGAPYEVVNTYAESDLFDIHYAQSNDVVTLVHPRHPPKELKRLGAANWQLSTITFAPPLPAFVFPPVVTPTLAASPNNLRRIDYKLSLVDTAGNESYPSGENLVPVENNLFQTGAYNTLNWDAPANAVPTLAYYNVYKLDRGFFGFIGRTKGLERTFRDDNITPDISRTPLNIYTPFNSDGNYPSAVSYFEQRRVFAGTTNQPQNIWMTKSGTESDLSSSIPTRDDDAIVIRVAARESNPIRHIVPMNQLLLLTSAAEWRLSSVNSDVITPTTVGVKPQSYIGANNVPPVVVNNSLIFASARGGHVRELGYSQDANGYVTGDVSLRATHLFDELTITDLAYAKSPYPICWAVSSSGKLLGFTYVPEQQVGAWHPHTTDGIVESITVVPEGKDDVLYAVICRSVNNVKKRYIERLGSRTFTSRTDCFFVDSGLTYRGNPTSTVSGLSHLEGKTVSILADGSVNNQQVVLNGVVELDAPASVVTVGLPYTSVLVTLPIAAQIDNGFGQGRPKNVTKAWARVNRTSGLFVGTQSDDMQEFKQRTTENYGDTPALLNEELDASLHGRWAEAGQIRIEQRDPLPATVVSVTLEVAFGG
jgi:hypothetical protein